MADPAAPFAFRDPLIGAPPPAPSEKDRDRLLRSVAAARAGDAASAQRALGGLGSGDAAPPALRLAALYARLAAGPADDVVAELKGLTERHPTWLAPVEALADAALARGEPRIALERYRAALALAPDDRRLREREARVHDGLVAQRRTEGEAALAANDLAAVRKSALALLELEPKGPLGYQLLSRAALAAGKVEDAYTAAHQALARAPADVGWKAFTAELAMKTGRFAEAVEMYDALAAGDRRFEREADDARLEFRIQNMPDLPRRAAQSAKLTRGQFAVLLWWVVPEVRQAQAPTSADVAVDAVDRPDQGPLTRAIALGVLTVNRETHHVGPETAVTRTELGALVHRLAVLLARDRPLPACLAPDSPAVPQLVECGILPETGSRNVTGREALRGIERAARLAREGAGR